MSYWLWAIPLISALIGYLTNWVAIRMLFRPHTEKRLLGVRVPFTPGLIPRRRQEIARSIGRSVSRYLFTHEAIGARLGAPAFRRQVDELLEGLTERWFRRELPSLNALIPSSFRPEWAQWVAHAKERLDAGVGTLLTHPQVAHLLEQQAEERLQRWLDEPLERLLPPETLDALPEQLGALLQRLLEDDDLEGRVRGFLEQRLDRWVAEDRALAELVPERLKAIVYEKLEDAVPLILERFVKILEDDDVRKRIKIQLFEMVDELLSKTFREDSVWDQFKFGLMETFVISPEEIKARIDDGIDEAAPRIAELVRREDVRQKVYRALVDAIENFLNRKISTFNVEAHTWEELKARLSRWLVSLLQSPTLRAQLVAFVSAQIERHRGKRLCELWPALSEEMVDRTARRLSEGLIRWLRSEAARERVGAFVSAQVDAWLERPLGRLDRFFPPGALERAQQVAGEGLVALLIRETPRILESLDVEELVSDQVSEFSIDEVERLIVGITGNQLRAITAFGAVLGFLIGLIQVGLLLAVR